ncbi:MAG: PLP-dependent aminotransferase family protein [Anaerolineales bacterium]|nr:PLP-dependent aminotransferase family protein [Anaerolineales bacterium]MBX3035645.1 PLP-dependent aminotransferase family protein [Anaerolineales bacterium]
MKLQTAQIQVPENFIDLGRGDPAFNLLPLEMLHSAAHNRLRDSDNSFLQYGTEKGDGYFRTAFANFLSKKYNFAVDIESLFITSGISAGLDLLCTLFTKPNDTIFVEEPSYFLALKIFADHGLKVASIRTDEHGLVIDDLILKLKSVKPKFVYVIPTFQNPAGRTLTQERREQLISLAKEHDFLIFADEVYQFLNYTQEPPNSLASFHSEHVISLGSFSKILAPGLRLGWLQTHESLMQKISSAGVLDSGGGMNPFTSTIVRHVIESGNLEKNLASLKQTFTKRIKVMDECLRKYIPSAEFYTPHGGYFFWVRIPNVDMTELREKAKTHHVGLRQGLLFSSNDSLKDYMRLSISFYDEGQLEEGIVRLKKCLE